jgi:hypothetical protein
MKLGNIKSIICITESNLALTQPREKLIENGGRTKVLAPLFLYENLPMEIELTLWRQKSWVISNCGS